MYPVDWRYAFDSGAFPGATNRQIGLRVNGAVLTNSERFVITGSFDAYQHSFLQARLNAGVNSITLFAVSKHGVARVDRIDDHHTRHRFRSERIDEPDRQRDAMPVECNTVLGAQR